MEISLLFGLIVVAVSLCAFLSARRFGVLALGLAAGFVLAELWTDWLAGLIAHLDVLWLPHGVVATIILLLAPLGLLLIGGPRYKGRIDRLLAALMVGLLASVFLVKPMGRFMTLDGEALRIYSWLLSYWPYVVTAGLVLGVVDIFLMNASKKDSAKH